MTVSLSPEFPQHKTCSTKDTPVQNTSFSRLHLVLVPTWQITVCRHWFLSSCDAGKWSSFLLLLFWGLKKNRKFSPERKSFLWFTLYPQVRPLRQSDITTVFCHWNAACVAFHVVWSLSTGNISMTVRDNMWSEVMLKADTWTLKVFCSMFPIMIIYIYLCRPFSCVWTPFWRCPWHPYLRFVVSCLAQTSFGFPLLPKPKDACNMLHWSAKKRTSFFFFCPSEVFADHQSCQPHTQIITISGMISLV